MLLAVAIVVVVLVALPLYAVVTLVRRFRRNEELVSGGSFGDQLTGRGRG
jgi:uncharacterized membrane protein YqiK